MSDSPVKFQGQYYQVLTRGSNYQILTNGNDYLIHKSHTMSCLSSIVNQYVFFKSFNLSIEEVSIFLIQLVEHNNISLQG